MLHVSKCSGWFGIESQWGGGGKEKEKARHIYYKISYRTKERRKIHVHVVICRPAEEEIGDSRARARATGQFLKHSPAS